MTEEERQAFLAALARGFHPQMEPQSVAYLLDHFQVALKQIGFEIKRIRSVDFDHNAE